eukprot:287166-Rhodomonas_salina.2
MSNQYSGRSLMVKSILASRTNSKNDLCDFETPQADGVSPPSLIKSAEEFRFGASATTRTSTTGTTVVLGVPTKVTTHGCVLNILQDTGFVITES